MDLRVRWPRRRRWAAAGMAAALAVGGLGWTAAADEPAAVQRQDRFISVPETPGSKEKVRIDTSFFTSGGSARRPAVLLAHGFGGSKRDLRAQAEQLARDGYAVLTWSARGFGESSGEIGLNDPDREVADVSRLIDWLAEQKQVELDGDGDPRVGMAGASYGGAVSLLTAEHDDRVDAIAPSITWWNLTDVFFPQAVQGGSAGSGVFKKLWAGVFFSTGTTGTTGTTGSDDPSCGRFLPAVCEAFQESASTGELNDATSELLSRSSPATYAAKLDVPTLVFQGQTDSLFTLSQGNEIAQAAAENGAPVSVDWIAGGHDGGNNETSRVQGRITSWFDRYLKDDKGADTGPAFRVSRTGGTDTSNGRTVLRGATDDSYPGLDGTDEETLSLSGREQEIANPPGGSPPSITSVPGLGSVSSLTSSLGIGLSLDFGGQSAAFTSAELKETVQVTGAPTVEVSFGTDSADGSAVLFAKLYDVSADGSQQILPNQLAAPLRVTDAAEGRTVDVTLPAIDHAFESGHRMRVVLSSTDLGYWSPAEPATYTISAAGDLTVPTVPSLATGSTGLPSWTWGLPSVAVLLAGALLLTARRRTTAPTPDPELAEVPLRITGLAKKYAKGSDRYAVKDLSFTVERGQVLGLLGPNGAGKTTTLRMLMGLIRPDAGELRIFGHAVRPGAPVLSRLGSFVEGPGFLPHLTGRANLDLYWRATGRPAQDAHLEEALEIADLGEALDRAVRTYSQGMRQRLAIAQAMLGLPELLILDEPTNGLDPPQIREMRSVLVRYAATGRTVIVSSHLLAEVEQSCTHLVVMDRGKLVASGPVSEIIGDGDLLLIGTPVLDAPDAEAVVAKVAKLPGVGSAVPAEDGLLVRLDGLTVPELLVELVRLEIPVERIGPHRRLEDAFLTLIGAGS